MEQMTGLLQGSGYSIVIANLVTELKHLALRLLQDELERGLLEKDSPDLHPYIFITQNKEDGISKADFCGYSDDNSKYLTTQETSPWFCSSHTKDQRAAFSYSMLTQG